MDLDSGMHVEVEGRPIDLSDDDPHDHVEPDGAVVLDALLDVFNARDLDAVIDLCAHDCEIPGLAGDRADLGGSIADLWERRPTVHLTRDALDGRAVGVVWEHEQGWQAIGTVHVDTDSDDEVFTVLEFSDDPGLLDLLDSLPPDEDLPEGATWDEWSDNPDR